jgi:hypothetical protein
MAFFPVFLSVVYVVRNQSHQLESIFSDATRTYCSRSLAIMSSIVVDNASDDESVSILKSLTAREPPPQFTGLCPHQRGRCRHGILG